MSNRLVYVLSKKWGTEGSGNGEFDAPIGAAVDSSPNRVLVTDYNNHRIQVFVWKILIPITPIE